METEASETLAAPTAALSEAPAAAHGPCPECAARDAPQAQPAPEQFAYVVGRLDVRFPSLGIEREYQQRERMIGDLPQARNLRVRAVLERNPHLATRVGWILSVGGNPAFALSPTSSGLKESFFKALSEADQPDRFCVVIGRVGPFVNPASYGGLLLPLLMVDQIYVGSLEEWAAGLTGAVKNVLKARKISEEAFQTASRELFRNIIGMPDNMGVSDGHRALNYLLAQHPGMFLAAAERKGHVLDRIETRVQLSAGGRRHVAAILSFVERVTGVAERLFCSVDVTEEWPFVVGGDGASSPLGFAPFLENGFYAAA
jgi:hypothetical protein